MNTDCVKATVPWLLILAACSPSLGQGATTEATIGAMSKPSATVVAPAAGKVDSWENKRIGSGMAGERLGLWQDWGQTLLALAVVVGLIFLVRRAMAGLSRRPRWAKQSEAIEAIVQYPISAKCRLSLVRLGKRLVLVGIGPSGPVRLAEVTDPAEAEEIMKAIGHPVSAAGDKTKGVKQSAVAEAAENIRVGLSRQKDQA
jgi:flagellar biogenesis protein FliO